MLYVGIFCIIKEGCFSFIYVACFCEKSLVWFLHYSTTYLYNIMGQHITQKDYTQSKSLNCVCEKLSWRMKTDVATRKKMILLVIVGLFYCRRSIVSAISNMLSIVNTHWGQLNSLVLVVLFCDFIFFLYPKVHSS